MLTVFVVVGAVLLLAAGATTLSRRPRVVVVQVPAEEGSGGLLPFMVGVTVIAVLVAVVLVNVS
ncbi:hypothetical protein [Dactylosporangium sp. CA-139066]|uniref:hypothetical protein n=1 Tax=Dactylosporangium sp. CA-139066 TaxID=3239930 RepID=UPI003D8B1EE5